MNYRVFTYGTLMKGRSNHHYVKDEQYLYDGVLYGYGLKETPYAYPAAIPMEGFKVYGEIYEVDEKAKKEVETENGSEKVLFYEYIEDTSFMKTRKPEGKWSVIRQDID